MSIQLQATVNAFRGLVPGLTPIELDGQIGAKTAAAASRVATFLLRLGAGDALVGPNFGQVSVGITGRDVAISAANLQANVNKFLEVTWAWLEKNNMGAAVAAIKQLRAPSPASEAAPATSLTPANAARAGKPSFFASPTVWWIAGGLAMVGAGVLGFFMYRGKVR